MYTVFDKTRDKVIRMSDTLCKKLMKLPKATVLMHIIPTIKEIVKKWWKFISQKSLVLGLT